MTFSLSMHDFIPVAKSVPCSSAFLDLPTVAMAAGKAPVRQLAVAPPTLKVGGSRGHGPAWPGRGGRAGERAAGGGEGYPGTTGSIALYKQGWYK